jgi:translation initiation factor 1
MTKYSALVYSTNKAPADSAPEIDAPRRQHATSSPQTARISLDRKGRQGKSVTLIQGLSICPDHMETLCKTLKTNLGTGGTVKEGHIEIQGDHRAKAAALLQKLNYKIKLIGG